MKISELIEELQERLKENGDINVYAGRTDNIFPMDIVEYDEIFTRLETTMKKNILIIHY